MRELTKKNTVYRCQEMAVQSFPGGDGLRFRMLRTDEDVSYLNRGEVAELGLGGCWCGLIEDINEGT